MHLASDDADAQSRNAAFLQGLQELGWAVGRNVRIDYRWGASNFDPERMRKGAVELVALAPDVVLATTVPIVLALQEVSRTVPIVFAGAIDPVGAGRVASLARPGGNLTGINLFSGELTEKRLELLREMVPQAARIAVLVNPAFAPTTETTLRDVQSAARAMGLQIQVLNASTSREIDAAFATFVHGRPDAVFVGIDVFFNVRRAQLVNLASYHRVPAAFVNRDFSEIGGLMSYGSNIADSWRQVGVYTGHILKGAKPADLPVVQATKFELIINHQPPGCSA
jgi:putative ABC transport system substrate-binding protein